MTEEDIKNLSKKELQDIIFKVRNYCQINRKRNSRR